MVRIDRRCLKCLALGCVFIICWLLWLPHKAYGDAKAQGADGGGDRVVRVGYPIQAGLTEIDENGDFTGYSYEYLEEIAQYTGWNYEFVQVPGNIDQSLIAMIDMLEKGELDLLGAISYSDEMAKIFDYTNNNYGLAYTVLKVLNSNTYLNETNVTTYTPIRIAVVEGADNINGELEDYCVDNGMEPVLVACGDDEEQIQALREGRADALVSRDVIRTKDLKTIARFSPRPFYFASTKGRKDLISQVDMAIIKINESDPGFSINLYEKYFGNNRKELVLSDEEEEWISREQVIRVGIDQNRPPLQSFSSDEDSQWGISVDLLERIAADTGLKIEFVRLSSYQEMLDRVKQGAIDIAAGVPYDYGLAQSCDMILTRPYLTTQTTMAVNRQADPKAVEGKVLALPRGVSQGEVSDQRVRWYDSLPQCMEAVRRNEADYTIGNNYQVEYYYKQTGERDLFIVPQSGVQQKICFGVTERQGTMLLSILNKAVMSIPEGELQSMILHNSTNFTRKITFESFVRAYPIQTVLIACVVMLLLLGMVYLHMRSTVRTARQSALENERYRQLSELSGEYMFEYDYRKDRLTCSKELSVLLDGINPIIDSYVSSSKGNARFVRQILQRDKENWEFLYGTQEQEEEEDGRWYKVTCKLVRDIDKNPVYVLGKLADVSEDYMEREHLLNLAQMDGLTGVYNSAACRELIGTYCREGGAFFLLDIDYFKQINDNCGHYAGDQVLIQVGSVLKSMFRSEDIVGRLGGDEFVAFMRHVTERKAVEDRCEKIRRALRRISETEKSGLTVTASIGVSVGSCQDFNEFYQDADSALYQVKESGRDGFVIVSVGGVKGSGDQGGTAVG